MRSKDTSKIQSFTIIERASNFGVSSFLDIQQKSVNTDASDSHIFASTFNMTGFDIIGDVHGHADELELLLDRLAKLAEKPSPVQPRKQ